MGKSSAYQIAKYTNSVAPKKIFDKEISWCEAWT